MNEAESGGNICTIICWCMYVGRGVVVADFRMGPFPWSPSGTAGLLSVTECCRSPVASCFWLGVRSVLFPHAKLFECRRTVAALLPQ